MSTEKSRNNESRNLWISRLVKRLRRLFALTYLGHGCFCSLPDCLCKSLKMDRRSQHQAGLRRRDRLSRRRWRQQLRVWRADFECRLSRRHSLRYRPLCRSRSNDRWRAVRIDLKLVVVHSLDVDVPGAVDRESFKVGNRYSHSYRLRDGVILFVLDPQYVVPTSVVTKPSTFSSPSISRLRSF